MQIIPFNSVTTYKIGKKGIVEDGTEIQRLAALPQSPSGKVRFSGS